MICEIFCSAKVGNCDYVIGNWQLYASTIKLTTGNVVSEWWSVRSRFSENSTCLVLEVKQVFFLFFLFHNIRTLKRPIEYITSTISEQ